MLRVSAPVACCEIWCRNLREPCFTYHGAKTSTQTFFVQSFSKTLRVMDVRAENRGRPHQKVRFSAAPVTGRNFLTQGRPGVRVRNVRGKSGPKSLCLCCFFFPDTYHGVGNFYLFNLLLCLLSRRILWIFFRVCLGILHWKMAGIFGEFFLFSVSQEAKHEKSTKNSEQNSEQNSGQNSGRKFEKFGKLSFCNFSDLIIRNIYRSVSVSVSFP